MLKANFMGQQKNFFRFFVPFVLILVAVAGVYLFWNENFSDFAKAKKEQTAYEAAERRYVETMTADTYGGKTPQETLDLFVAALKKGDLDLASKYFILETHENDQNYLTWNAFRIILGEAQKDGRLERLLAFISNAEPDLISRSGEDDFKFFVRDLSGKLQNYINMRFNKYSMVWKVESL